MTAVKKCEVHLGEGAPSPGPQQLAKLVTGAQLQQLGVTLHVASGGRGGSV